jgi:hypothetical protein
MKPLKPAVKHPIQPLVFDAGGVVRFQGNAIVEWLFETKRINLNDIMVYQFDVDDLSQFWQLLGYSVSGYGDLSFVDPAIVAKADAEAARMLKDPGE